MTTQYVDQIVRVQDQATGPLGRMADAADKLYGGLQGAVGVGGLLAGALSLKSAWDSTERYLKSVKEVKELTGATASETDFLFSSARKAGVEYSQMQQVMFQLSRRGSMLEQTMAAADGRVPGLAKKFQRLGVDMTKGPVHALENMSEAVKAGKLDAGELMAQFRIPQSQVNDFKGFLEDLDKAKLRAAKAGGDGLVRDSDIDTFNQLENAQHRMHDAWNRVQVLVVSKFLPVAATYTEKFASAVEEVIPKAVQGARWLADHMEEIVRYAKVFATIMTGRKLMQVLSPGGALGGLLAQVAVGGGGGKGLGLAGAAMAPFQMLGGVVSQAGAVVGMLVRAVPALAAVAAAVWAVHAGYKYITESVDGTLERVRVGFDMIAARWENLQASLGQLWERVSGIFGVDGTFTHFVGMVAAGAFEAAVAGFDHILHAVRTIASMSGELIDMAQYLWRDALAEPARKVFEFIREGVLAQLRPWQALFSAIGKGVQKLGGWLGVDVGSFSLDPEKIFRAMAGPLMQAPIDLFEKHWKKTQEEDLKVRRRITRDRWVAEAKAGAGTDAPDKRPPQVNYDFRGSRFDITQNFAEGFDPDRIAVAFSEDLAALGERRTSSAFAPAFAAGR